MTEIIHATEEISGIKTYTSMPDIPKEFIVDGVKYKVTIEKEATE